MKYFVILFLLIIKSSFSAVECRKVLRRMANNSTEGRIHSRETSLRVMTFLSEQSLKTEKLTASQITQSLGISGPVINKTLNHFEEHSLITRKLIDINPGSKRKPKVITLTQKGHQAADASVNFLKYFTFKHISKNQEELSVLGDLIPAKENVVRILAYLYYSNLDSLKPTAREISLNLGISDPVVIKSLTQLEEVELVERVMSDINPGRKRKPKVITLTKKGRDATIAAEEFLEFYTLSKNKN
jgi:DNA-binding MarR family transcriptional regulator